MDIHDKMIIQQLNAPQEKDRLAALKKLKDDMTGERLPFNVNNHVHTTYSFSPYSPTAAIYYAKKAGLVTVGIMDHDSVAGCREFTRAGEIAGIATTCGIECRTNSSQLGFTEKTNNPDQIGVTYMAIHAIPAGAIDEVQEFFQPYREARNIRNRAITQKINALIADFGLHIDFDLQVLPNSMSHDGGTVTERHLLYTLSEQIIQHIGGGENLVNFLQDQLQVPVDGKMRNFLLDEKNSYLAYDLLGILKGSFIEKVFIPATDECPSIDAVVELAERIGAISAYPYLGDVGESVTGDKKAQKFEDEFLEQLLVKLKSIGVRAIAYMPTRNTDEQLSRLRKLCREMDFFQICGEDINQPRQSFLCSKLKQPEFSQLVDAAWAMIAHERQVEKDKDLGMFSQESKCRYPDLEERIQMFAQMGRQMF